MTANVKKKKKKKKNKKKKKKKALVGVGRCSAGPPSRPSLCSGGAQGPTRGETPLSVRSPEVPSEEQNEAVQFGVVCMETLGAGPRTARPLLLAGEARV